MVLTAGAGARVVLAAGFHALVAPFRASEVGQGQGVLGDVGLLAVAAEAAVGQGFRVTGVDRGGSRGVLLADDGASAELGLAPRGADAERNRIRVDVVVGTGNRGKDGGNSQDRGSERRHYGDADMARMADINGAATVL